MDYEKRVALLSFLSSSHIDTTTKSYLRAQDVQKRTRRCSYVCVEEMKVVGLSGSTSHLLLHPFCLLAVEGTAAICTSYPENHEDCFCPSDLKAFWCKQPYLRSVDYLILFYRQDIYPSYSSFYYKPAFALLSLSEDQISSRELYICMSRNTFYNIIWYCENL